MQTVIKKQGGCCKCDREDHETVLSDGASAGNDGIGSANQVEEETGIGPFLDFTVDGEQDGEDSQHFGNADEWYEIEGIPQVAMHALYGDGIAEYVGYGGSEHHEEEQAGEGPVEDFCLFHLSRF